MRRTRARNWRPCSLKPPERMTGESTVPAKKRRLLPSRRRVLRSLMWSALALTLLIAGLLAAVYWSVSTEAGGRTLIELLSRWTGGSVQVEGWQGRVGSHFEARRLRLHLASMDIDAERIVMDWRPVALAHHLLDISTLHVGRLEVRRTPGPDEPARMPDNLRLPIDLHIGALQLGVFAMGERPSAGALPLPPTLLLNDVAASVDSDARSHRINSLALDLPAGHVSGKGRIDLASPYALTAQASFAGKVVERSIKVDAQADGSLENLALKLKAAGEGVTGDADVQVRPFQALPVERARISLRGIDPSAFSESAPKASLDVLAKLTPALPANANAADKDPARWRVSGPVEVVNRRSAPIDQGGVPLERLSTQMSWAAGALQLSGLQISLPGQGRIKGSLGWQQVAGDPLGKIEADLKVQALDPSRLHTKLSPMQIAGSISGKSVGRRAGEAPPLAGAPAQDQEFRMDLVSGAYHLKATGAQRGGVLELQEAALNAGNASVEARGRWQWLATTAAPAQAFSASGRVQSFDPHVFVQSAPVGKLNADFSVDGVLKPTMEAKLALNVDPSMLAKYPLQGRAIATVQARRVHDADISFDVLGNSIKLAGAFGLPADRMRVMLDAPQLGRLQAGLHGKLTANGTLGGTLEEPSLSLSAHAESLGKDDVGTIDSVLARLELEPGSSGRIDGRLDVKGVNTAGEASPLVRTASIVVDGRRDTHAVRIDAALLKDQTLSLVAQGGWRAPAKTGGPTGNAAWQGQLQQLVAKGPLALRLKEPATLSLSPRRVALGEAALVADNGNIQLTTTEWTPLRTVARGRMTGLQIGFAVDELQRTVMRGKSLQLGAEWDVTLAERANGLVRVFREGGDFILQGDAPVALGLETLELNLAAQEDRLALSALVSGTRVGAINFAGTAQALRQGSRVTLSPTAPITGVGHLEIPSIDWLGPVIDQNLRTGGSIVGDFNVLGTAEKPQGNGRIIGSALTVGLADQGLRLRDGQLELSFDAARITLSKFDFRAERSVPPPDPRIRVLNLPGAEPGSNAGRISGTGGIDLKDGAGQFALKLEHVPVLQRPDQWAIVSGTAGITSGWDHMDLTARLAADAGFIGVPKSGAPVLGDDVLVRGRVVKTGQRMRVNADIDFDFGRDFIVKAWGIDTYLDGQLHLRLAQGLEPRATGALQTRGGVFDAYGQKLTIDRGLINFSGPLNNPALNVVATRKGLPVEAGVQITGAVQQPRVRLVSDPEVPESEKLSWILLGRPTDASSADAGLLLSAASAAFGNGDGGPGITQRVANSLGLDDVSLGQAGAAARPVQSRVVSNSSGMGSGVATSGTANEQVLTLGRRLSSKAYLALEQNLIGTESVIKLSYELTRYISLIARGGTENALDLHYEISFR